MKKRGGRVFAYPKLFTNFQERRKLYGGNTENRRDGNLMMTVAKEEVHRVKFTRAQAGKDDAQGKEFAFANKTSWGTEITLSIKTK